MIPELRMEDRWPKDFAHLVLQILDKYVALDSTSLTNIWNEVVDITTKYEKRRTDELNYMREILIKYRIVFPYTTVVRFAEEEPVEQTPDQIEG